MKKNIMMRLASVLLVAVILSTCAISGTFAKYTSENTATATGTVAKWSFEVEGTEIAVNGSAPAVTFNLFDTWNDTNDSKDTVSNNLLAPGTTGSFNIEVENKSEVMASYKIEFTKADTNNGSTAIPIEFSANGTDGWDTDISKVNIADTELAISAGKTTHTIYWRWQFDNSNDANDTILGVLAQQSSSVPTMTISAKVTATQVD